MSRLVDLPTYTTRQGTVQQQVSQAAAQGVSLAGMRPRDHALQADEPQCWL